MSPGVAFPLFLLVTLAFLGCVVVTGRSGRRRAHVALVACALASLATTIYFAEKLGDSYDIESAGWITPVHLTLAKATVGAYLLPLATGVRTWYDDRHRALHKKLAYLVLALTGATAVTGTAMLLLSDKVAP